MKIEERIGGRGSGKMMELEEWLTMFPTEVVKDVKITRTSKGVTIKLPNEKG